MSVVHYKFKNNLDYKTISFDGLSIALGDLKQAIMSQNKTKSGEFDLEITNAQSKEAYTDNSTQIPKNASVVIRRIPVGPKGKALTAAERPESPGNLATKPTEDEVEDPPVIPLSKLNKVPDLASANASEEDKITAMMNQAGEEWDPALYAKPRGRQFNAAPRHPPPAHYMCFRCRKPGHWIQNCPKNNDPNYDMKVRRTTGIPKSFLRLADKPSQKGALLIAETGQYAVPIVDHNAYEQAASKKRAKDITAGTTETEKVIPQEYICPLCKKVMTNAVVVPCCGDSFCNSCIEKYLLENDQVCPSCRTEDVSPASLVINKHLRQAIIKARSFGYDATGSNSAASSPIACRDEDISTEGRNTPGHAIGSAVSSVESGVTSNQKMTSSSSDAGLAKSSASVTTTQSDTHVTTTAGAVPMNQATAVVPQAANVPVSVSHVALSDHRLQRPDGIVQPITMPVPAAVPSAPIHRPAYVVSASAVPHVYHPAAHHTVIHPTVPSIGVPSYGHLAHPTLVPARHTLPFANLDPDPAMMMMNEEEFYRAKMKLKRGTRKRRKDEEKKGRSNNRSGSRRRERRESPSSRRSHARGYPAAERDRSRRRDRSRSWSGSSSQSSWSHSWSRSKSPSRSYSRSKSRTPVDWQRSRSPSPSVKRKNERVEVEGRKRKTQVDESKKKSSEGHAATSKASEKLKLKTEKSGTLEKGEKKMKKKIKSDSAKIREADAEKPSERLKKNFSSKSEAVNAVTCSPHKKDVKIKQLNEIHKVSRRESSKTSSKTDHNDEKMVSKLSEKIDTRISQKSSEDYSVTKNCDDAEKMPMKKSFNKRSKAGQKVSDVSSKEAVRKEVLKKKSVDLGKEMVKTISSSSKAKDTRDKIIRDRKEMLKKKDGKEITSNKEESKRLKSENKNTGHQDTKSSFEKTTTFKHKSIKERKSVGKTTQVEEMQKSETRIDNKVKVKKSKEDASKYKTIAHDEKGKESSAKDSKLFASKERTSMEASKEDKMKDIKVFRVKSKDLKKSSSSSGDYLRNEDILKTARSSREEKSSRYDRSDSLSKIKKRESEKLIKLPAEKRTRNPSNGATEKSVKSRKRSVSEESDDSRREEIPRDSKTLDEKRRKKRKSKSESEDSDDERLKSRKRIQQDSDDDSGGSEMAPKRKKKKKPSVEEEERKESKRKKRKHKKKHRKHKHKKKSKRREKGKERKKSEDDVDSEESEGLEEKDSRGHKERQKDKNLLTDKSSSVVAESRKSKNVQSQSDSDVEEESECESESEEVQDHDMRSGESDEEYVANDEDDDDTEVDDVARNDEGTLDEKVLDVDDEIEELDYDEDSNEGREENEDEIEVDDEVEESAEEVEKGHEAEKEVEGLRIEDCERDGTEEDEDEGAIEEDEEEAEGNEEEEEVVEGNEEEEEVVDENEEEEVEGNEDSETEEEDEEDDEEIVEETEDDDNVEESENEHNGEVEVDEDEELEENDEAENNEETEVVDSEDSVEDEEEIEVEVEEIVEIELGEEEMKDNEDGVEVIGNRDIISEEALLEDSDEEAALPGVTNPQPENIAEASMKDGSYDKTFPDNNIAVDNVKSDSTKMDGILQETAAVSNDVSEDNILNLDRKGLNKVVIHSKNIKDSKNMGLIRVESRSAGADETESVLLTDNEGGSKSEKQKTTTKYWEIKRESLSDDVHTTPNLQSSWEKSEKNDDTKSRNSQFYHGSGRHNPFEHCPSYDSGVGVASSLDSMFDEFDDPNYTDFGALNVKRRNSTDTFQAMRSGNAEDFPK